MYRNYIQTRSCCSCTNQKCNNDEQNIMDDTCEYVQNVLDSKDVCECGFDEEDKMFPTNPMFAQSYVPWHTMDKTFTPCVGLKMGTIFPELVSPYMPGQSMAEIEFIRRNNKIGEGCNNKC